MGTAIWFFEDNVTLTINFSAFHDCVTVCDGCVDTSNPDNAGLQEVIDDLETIYPTYSSLVESRGDFWTMAAIAAINMGVRSSNRRCTAT